MQPVIENIDLARVFKELPDYQSYYFSNPIAGIPDPFCESLLGEINVITWDLGLRNDSPSDQLSEFTNYIQSGLEELFKEVIALLQDEDSPPDNLGDLFSNNYEFAHHAFLVIEYEKKGLASLVIYLYDQLIKQYRDGDFEGAFFTLEGITEARCRLAENLLRAESPSISPRLSISRNARRAAMIRHSPNRELEKRLADEWLETSDSYQSRADFVRIIAKREGMKERTLDSWIARSLKARQNITS